MTREEIIRNLEYTMEKHKNDTVYTFDTNISLMCKNILDYLEQEHCEDCISRKEAIKAMEDKAKGLKNLDTINGLCGAVAILYDLPSIQPIRPKGEWIVEHSLDYLQGDIYKCSHCGHYCHKKIDECPNCGADMRDIEK